MQKEEKLLEERKRKIFDIITKKKLVIIIGLIILLYLAYYIRTANVPKLKDITTNDYTLGPDPDSYLFLRYAKYIVENGKLMEHDSMRNVPLGFNTKEETKLLPYMIAYFHKIISIFTRKSVVYSAIMFPVFMFLLTVIAFFLFIREIFKDNKYKNIIALIASAFLIVSPFLLQRTVAGIPDKESVSFLFMILSFYFFLASWKANGFKKSLFLAFLAGLSTGLMGLVWGGVRYVYLIISLFVFLEFIIGKVDKKRFFLYSIWIFTTCIFLIIFWAEKYSIMIMINAPTSSGFSLGIFLLILIDILIFNTKIKDLNFIKKLRKKLPDKVVSIIFFIVLGFIAFIILFNASTIFLYFREIFFSLARTGTDRLSFTVAENKEPFFSEWESNFGPHIKGIAVLFWFFFLGSIFLFYDTIRKIKRKEKWILTFSYIIFLLALIFSRYSPESIMNGISSISKIVHLFSYILMAVSLCYIFYKNFKIKKLIVLKKINSSYIFLLVFFIISLIGARSAIRLITVLVFPVSGIIGYFLVSILERARGKKDKTLRSVFYVIAIVVVIAALYSFYYNYNMTLLTAKENLVPSIYTQQWQKAMAWVRDNTSKDAVFAHWWDYGYRVQSIGNRATVLDGGNVISYWNYLLGRHVLTGQSEREALEFLYAHNATYLLIDSTDIGKYPAYSSIGSDENYDRYSLMHVFVEDNKNVQKKGNITVHPYLGDMLLDQDYIYTINGKQELFPNNKVNIMAVFLREEGNNTLKQPQAAFIYQGKQTNIPMRYVYFEGKLYDFETGYGGGLYIIPGLASASGKMFIKNTGQALFISEKSMKALWVKLYLFNQAENFELVHKEDNFIVRDLKNQNANVGDFVIYGDVQGPIKIWKINYPDDIEFNPDYLKTEYPESLRLAKEVF